MIMSLLVLSVGFILFPVYSSRGCPIDYDCEPDYCKRCCEAGRDVTPECLSRCNLCYPWNDEAHAEGKDFPN